MSVSLESKIKKIFKTKAARRPGYACKFFARYKFNPSRTIIVLWCGVKLILSESETLEFEPASLQFILLTRLKETTIAIDKFLFHILKKRAKVNKKQSNT